MALGSQNDDAGTNIAAPRSGRVALRRYLEQEGMVAADNLNPQKARIYH